MEGMIQKRNDRKMDDLMKKVMAKSAVERANTVTAAESSIETVTYHERENKKLKNYPKFLLSAVSSSKKKKEQKQYLPTAELQEWKDRGDDISKSFIHKGHKIFYRDEGDKKNPVLICLHGFPTASYDWHKIWDELTQKFRVIAPDFIGFGFSDKPYCYDYTVADQADLVVDLVLKHLQISNSSSYHLLAHDFGATVAQELLARYNISRSGSQTSSQNSSQKRSEHSSESEYDVCCTGIPIANNGSAHLYDVHSKTRKLKIESAVILNGGIIPDAYRPRIGQRLIVLPVIGPILGFLGNKKRFAYGFNKVFGPNTKPSKKEMDEYWALFNYNSGKKNAPKIMRYILERQENGHRWVNALQVCKKPIRFINGPADPISGKHVAVRYMEIVPNPDVVILEVDIGHYPQIEDATGTLLAFWEFHRKIKNLSKKQ